MLGEGVQKQLKKNNRYYLRFHSAISRAIELNKQIFNGKMSKDGKEPCFEHSLRVAGYCEEILDQTMLQYHECWLLGILHDNKEQNPVLFSQKINEVLQDLFENEQADIKKYIDVLTSNKTNSKGDQKKEQLIKAQKMDLIPSWILLFDKLDNCKRFKKDSCGKSKQELDGYYSVAYLIYLTLTKRHNQIKEYLITDTHDFYKQMGKELGGEAGAKKCAQKYFKSMA